MNPGFPKRNIVTTRGYDMYENVLKRANELIVDVPSLGVQTAQRKLARALMIAANNNINAYHDIYIVASNITFGGSIPTNLGFDGISWLNPDSYGLARTGANTKTANRGYSSNSNAPIQTLFPHRFIPSVSDLFMYGYIWNVSQSNSGFGVFDLTETRSILIYPKWNNASFLGKAVGNINSSYPASAPLPTIADGTNNGYCIYNRISGANIVTGFEINGVVYGEQNTSPGLGLSLRNLALCGATSSLPSQQLQSCLILGYKSLVDTIALHNAVQTYLNEIA